MILHKIRGISKQICTAEQMIAYNLSNRYGDILLHGYKEIQDKPSFIKSDFIRKSVYRLTHLYEFCYGCKKYNIDAIFCALGAGLEEYLKSGCPILCTYENVSRMFPVDY